MMIFKVGTYKGAVEPFMLDKLSDANREQIQSYISTIWDNVTNGIAESRKIQVADINNFANQGYAFAAAEKAVECGLIDELKYRPEAEEFVKRAGWTKRQTPTDCQPFKYEKHQKPSVVKGRPYSNPGMQKAKSNPKLPSSPYNTEQAITEKVTSELIKLKNDENVKAVVFRVNSPGGRASASRTNLAPGH